MLEIQSAPAASDATDVELGETSDDARRAAGRLGRALSADAEFETAGLAGDRLSAFVEGLALGAYRVRDAVSHTVRLCGADDDAALSRGLARAAATAWARDLTNTPSDVKTPTWLGEQAATRLGPHGVEVEVRDEAWLVEQGFGGVLAVGGGSQARPRLIEARWRPRGAKAGVHVVLVGKGITFDTGGYNRKVGPGMRTMNTDMAGGAAVLAALELIAGAKAPVRVTALVPTAENSISGSAYRPGDVVRHYGGRTSEIHNTDAEGRLVLADALAYAVAKLRPTVLIDIATLTGAMKVALGMRTGGLLATSDELADALVDAGADSGEPLWRLPLRSEYEGTLHSDVADANNSPGNPGGITAALFLQHFVKDVPWAHLDVAGPARAGEDDGMFTKGATGFGARLLARYVDSLV